MKPALTGLGPEEIAAALELKPFQARQIFSWLHQKQVFDFQRMTDLSKALRARLEERYSPSQLTVERTIESEASGTRKALFRLQDGLTVEAVLLRDRDRHTVCVSCQVGCALACRFCATGQDGFSRNLNPGEIVEQVLHLVADQELVKRTPNLVYMGMGEPFENYDAVVRSIRLLMDKHGLSIGARKITVSTIGHVPGIQRFAREGWQVRLSVSLHSARDETRARIVPIAYKYPLDVLFQALRDYAAETGRQITIEWVLLDGLNDTIAEANALARRLKGIDAAVNLIPFNPFPDCGFSAPHPAKQRQFLAALRVRGIGATLRQERGADINAACGQLRRNPS